jgi:hypothetical protein
MQKCIGIKKQILFIYMSKPESQKGKVYQVWSLTLDSLKPTSLGTLDSFTADANKFLQ